MFNDVVIAAAARTAIGSFGGSLKNVSTIDMSATIIRECIERSGIPTEAVEEVVLGCVGQYGWNPFLARIAGLKAGCSEDSTGQTVNRLCASGLQAIVTAATAIDHGDCDVCVAGGAENMSNFPYHSYESRWGKRLGSMQLLDSLDMALGEPMAGQNGKQIHIAVTAENIAQKYGITRKVADEYALKSQQKAAEAINKGKFRDEIIPVEVKTKKTIEVFDTDEHPRETSMEKLAKLRPLLPGAEIVTAGNASGINDAAAAMLLTNLETALKYDCKILGKVVDYAVSGVDPNYMGMGPVASSKKLLEKVGLSIKDIGLWEINEAFATQAIACIQELDIREEIVNVNGSGISLGHPIGATGAVISVKLLYEMKRRSVQYGIATLCIGGGQGLSVLYENI